MITCFTPTSGFRTSVDDGISCDAFTLNDDFRALTSAL